MNERIKELSKQAWAWAEQQEYKDATQEFSDILEQKFAELIVKECTNYMNSRTEDWDAKLRWIFNDGSGYMEVDVDSLLKEHFGVDE